MLCVSPYARLMPPKARADIVLVRVQASRLKYWQDEDEGELTF
ncbi:hypothetical protein GCM10022406_10020 [Hymenobacter algoricola]|uniref:Uncharacterized protein n=1 Tax=Hymenobacter algoricola TaxID=486267 RepID=A0ABP7MQZ4_9BACT